MGFFHQFDEFDPLTGTPPDYPFLHLPLIVQRARSLLRLRTRDEIIAAAQHVDYFIEEYFASEKDRYVRRLLETGGWELGFLPNEARNEAGVRELLDNWPSEANDPPPNIPTSDNTSEVDALKECIGTYELDGADFPRGREREYFAVLALWLVADAMRWLKWTSDPEAMRNDVRNTFQRLPSGPLPELAAVLTEVQPKASAGMLNMVDTFEAAWKHVAQPDVTIQFSLAGESALCAMDAVCYAEQLFVAEILTSELAQLRSQLQQQGEEIDKLADERAKQRVSVAARDAAIQRHHENHAMKEQVFAWYAAHGHEYASMDAAAEAVAGKLVPVVFRTARCWIGEYRKKERSARRQ